MRIMTLSLSVAAVLVGVETAPSSAADKFEAQRKFMQQYLKAFASADTASMKKYYAPTVIVGRGSTLLRPKYGGLTDGKEYKKKDFVVKRERLLEGYQRAIKAFGGAEQWKKRGADLLKKEVRFIKVSKKQEAALQAKKVNFKAGDVLAIVIPKGDSLTFFLRKNKAGNWRIVGEHWD